MELLLQIWGGLFYLLNKVFLSRKERTTGNLKRSWEIFSWIVYIIGLPAWIIIFYNHQNAIAASVELGGLPSMFLGLINSIKRGEKEIRGLKMFALFSAVLGFLYSIYLYKGLSNLNQFLEIGIAIGFLVGTFLLANKNTRGYLWFILMNISNSLLMASLGNFLLMAQQIVSLGFVYDAYKINQTKIKSN